MTLSCKKLVASYDATILNGIDFSIQTGDFVCISGANGSGKSTLLKIVSGIDNGIKITAEILPNLNNGKNQFFIKDMKTLDIAKHIAFLPQNENYAWDTTVFDMILTGRFSNSNAFYADDDYKTVENVADFLKIKDLFNRNVYSLSGGEFQKCRIARTLAQKAFFYIFDEPTANIDIVYEIEILQKLKELSKNKNVGVLVSIHNINMALHFAEKIALLAEKNIIFGDAEKVITQKNIDITYGKGLTIYEHPLWHCVQVG